MITLKELNPSDYPTTPEIDANLIVLLERINRIRKVYGHPMTVTSGLRSDAKQKALIAAGKSTATASKHLTGQAVDIFDPKGELKDWVKLNLPLIEEVGLWLENFAYTSNWVHFQTVAPKSGKRFFVP